MPIFGAVGAFFSLVSLLLLGGGGYLIWSWARGAPLVAADGEVVLVREAWRFWCGAALLGWSFFGRAVVLALAARRGEEARPPVPEGEAVAVNLVQTSTDLSTDALYQRTARADNLLRWDLEVPAGAIGDKTMYLNYEFRLEYARDLPQPRFVSDGLRESPIGGGAMGLGGMGGFRSVRLGDE